MALKQGDSDSYHIWRSGSQLLKLLHTDETEQKAPDVEIPSGRDCGLRELSFPLDVTIIFLWELRSL